MSFWRTNHPPVPYALERSINASAPLMSCSVPFHPRVKDLAKDFPKSLDGVPAILPVGEMALRRELEHWFDLHQIRPRVVAEVEDTALLTDLRAQGLGFVPLYSAVLDEIARSSRFQRIGTAKGLRTEIFAITAQRRLQHPAVVAMTMKSN
jgi:LysR family transcriptional regulator, transcriptional activator of nhaA